MSELIKHECGIAMIRLRKPLSYYQEKYGSWRYGLDRMYLLMEKQHNRGQDGAGLAGIKIGLPSGIPYIFKSRSNQANPIKKVFEQVGESIEQYLQHNEPLGSQAEDIRMRIPFASEVYLGHLRYGTYGSYKIDYVHPVTRENNWRSRNLVMAGNFNLTNVDEVFDNLVSIGQHPTDFSDTVTVLENVGHFLDEEVEALVQQYRDKGLSKQEISPLIEDNLNVGRVLQRASKNWDGGYVMAGMVGHGDAFVLRDPWGIRPAYYYYDDEVAVVTSERPVIQTVFNRKTNEVQELMPGHAIILRKNGDIQMEQVREPGARKACSFERIYFSRGSDKYIYRERKRLGELLTSKVLEAIEHDMDNTVFSYIPNTSETAFYGLVKGVETQIKKEKIEKIWANGKLPVKEELERIIEERARVEKVAIKDVKLRTFITEDKSRDDLVGHVYDVTYGALRRKQDRLVIIDDSIVRGTTLKKSIIRILDRLDPKQIVVVSSAPQIRYPDCYGIDMAKLGDFIAFRAAIQLLKDSGRESLIQEVYQKALKELEKPKEEMVNVVKEIYAPFSDEEVSAQIASMLKTDDIQAEVKVVYQTIPNLHQACPENLGDWYFSGDYPTPGGVRVANRAFVNYVEGRNVRAY